jgi:hypothetical protein
MSAYKPLSSDAGKGWVSPYKYDEDMKKAFDALAIEARAREQAQAEATAAVGAAKNLLETSEAYKVGGKSYLDYSDSHQRLLKIVSNPSTAAKALLERLAKLEAVRDAAERVVRAGPYLSATWREDFSALRAALDEVKE